MKIRSGSHSPVRAGRWLAAGIVVVALGFCLSMAPAAWAQATGSDPTGPTKSGWKGEFAEPAPPSDSELLRSGAGGLETLPEENQLSGNLAVRAVRHAAGQLRGELQQMTIAAVEGNGPQALQAADRARTLFEIVRESDPSDILTERLKAILARLDDPKRGDPGIALFRLQVDVERFRHLYPLQDLERMAATAKRLEAEGKPDLCRDGVAAMLPAVALPDLDVPLDKAGQAFQAAVSSIGARKYDEARQQLKAAVTAIEQVADGTYLAECGWYVALADQALEEGSTRIAALDLGYARELLVTAAVGKSPPLSATLADLLSETDSLRKAMGKPGAMPTTRELRTLIEQIDKAI